MRANKSMILQIQALLTLTNNGAFCMHKFMMINGKRECLEIKQKIAENTENELRKDTEHEIKAIWEFYFCLLAFIDSTYFLFLFRMYLHRVI